MRGLTCFAFLLVIILVACDKPVKESGDTSQSEVQPTPPPLTQAVDPGSLVDPVEPDPEGLAELVPGPEGDLLWKDIELPRNWPEEIPLVADGRVIFCERAVYKDDQQNGIVQESQIPEIEVEKFYMEGFEKLGWERLENSRGPGFINLTYLWEDRVVDINAKHVPEETNVEMISAESAESDFEGTVVKVHIMPAGNLDHFTGATAWYGLDALPPGYPQDLVPPYPGAQINMASFADGDHTVLQQASEDEDITKAIKFYGDYYSRLGLEPEVTEETDEVFLVEYKGDDCFVRISIVDNTLSPAEIFIDIYRQETAGE